MQHKWRNFPHLSHRLIDITSAPTSMNEWRAGSLIQQHITYHHLQTIVFDLLGTDLSGVFNKDVVR